MDGSNSRIGEMFTNLLDMFWACSVRVGKCGKSDHHFKPSLFDLLKAQKFWVVVFGMIAFLDGGQSIWFGWLPMSVSSVGDHLPVGQCAWHVLLMSDEFHLDRELNLDSASQCDVYLLGPELLQKDLQVLDCGSQVACDLVSVAQIFGTMVFIDCC